MSIFDRHKNGHAPAVAKAEPVVETAPDASLQARFADALARNDGYNAWRLYGQGGQALLGNGDAVLPLARYLSAENRPDDALALLNGFAGRYPGHRDIVHNYLLAAHIMRRDFGDHDGAHTLLTRLAESYRDHADYALIEQALHTEEKP